MANTAKILYKNLQKLGRNTEDYTVESNETPDLCETHTHLLTSHAETKVLLSKYVYVI
jgi:hypothetical protein